MRIEDIPKIGSFTGPESVERPGGAEKSKDAGGNFGALLREAIESVDGMQRTSEAAQAAYASGDPVDLHDVLIKIEEADVAFKTMMEVRNKLLDAYREVMRSA